MPRGRPKKVQGFVIYEEEKGKPQAEVLNVEVPKAVEPKAEEVKKERPAFRERAALSTEEIIKQSRKALDEPLQEGQKYFETPDGEIIVGEAGKNEVWSRRLNAWVNPRR